jgi:hypothetical protein
MTVMHLIYEMVPYTIAAKRVLVDKLSTVGRDQHYLTQVPYLAMYKQIKVLTTVAVRGTCYLYDRVIHLPP